MKKKILIPIIIVLILLAAVGTYLYINSGFISEKIESKVLKENLEIEQPKIKTFSGDDRPIAVMIDNNTNAWPQASVNEAYIIYEIIVEGGETRLMALFKGSDADSIGPIRSSRHYFLDYALENDAIYAHLGWSPQAQSDISSLKVNNINGQAYDTGKARTDSSLFWRSKKVKPHNAYTNIESLLEISKKLNLYRKLTTYEEEDIVKWTENYGYSMDIIEIALKKALSASTATIIDSFGTNKVSMEEILEYVNTNFSFRLSNIISELDLLRPIYKQTACFGHFGRNEFPWEQIKD